MAYGTYNPTAISVTNFGAKGDGSLTNSIAERDAIQRAIDSLQTKGLPGTIAFPGATSTYLFSGTLNVTGRGISFVSTDGSILKSYPDESAKKFNLSGAQHIAFEGLTFDANRVATTPGSNQNGFISTINTQNITVMDCNLVNTRDSMVYLGGGTCNALIANNFLSGYFCGVYSMVNVGDQNSTGFIITNNFFAPSYLVSEVNESAAIKLQTTPLRSGMSRLHTISNNVINCQAQMGIELWTNLADCAISSNTIGNTTWGISIDHSTNVAITNNTIRTVGLLGIEAATLCDNISIVGNVVDNFPLSGAAKSASSAILITNSGKNINITSNILRGFNEKGIHLYKAGQVDIQDNLIEDNTWNVYIQDSSFVNVFRNTIKRENVPVFNHIIVDYTSIDITGVFLSDNRFRGVTEHQGIQVFRSTTPHQVNGFLIKNNQIDEGTYATGGFVDVQNLSDFSNILFTSNFCPTGGGSEYTIQDYSPNSAYGTSNIYAGIQYYKSAQITIPSGGITGVGAWFKVYDTAGNASSANPRFRVINNEDGSWDNTRTNVEVWAAVNPYGGNSIKHSLSIMPQSPYGPSGSFLQEVRTSYVGDGSQVWMRIGPVSSGSIGRTITVYSSDQYGVNTLSGTYIEPTWPAESAQLLNIGNSPLGIYTELLMKTSKGYGVGLAGSLYDNGVGLTMQSTGSVTITGKNIALCGGLALSGIATSASAAAGGVSLPATAAGFVTVNITGRNFKVPYYN